MGLAGHSSRGRRGEKADQSRDRAAGAGPGDLLRRPAHGPCADLRAGARGRPHLGRLHQRRHGARLVRHGRPRRVHARAGRRRADALRPPHAGRDRRAAGARHRRGRRAAPTAGRCARSWPAACTGCCCARPKSADAVRAFVEAARYPQHAAGVDPALPSPLERMRGVVPRQAAAADGDATAARRRHARPRLGGDGGRDLGAAARGVHAALRSLAAQPAGRAAARRQDREPRGRRELREDPGGPGHRLRGDGAGRPRACRSVT